MSDTITLRIRESGSRKVATGFGKVDKSLGRMGRTGGRAALAVGRGMGKLGGIVSRLTGLIGGLGVAMGGRAILKFDDVLGQLQADAGLTTASAKKLRAEMLGVSVAVGISKDEVAAAAKEWQDYTGVLKKMRPYFKDVAEIAKATGAPMEKLATISAALIDSLGMTPKGAVDVLRKMSEQARFGALNMVKVARVMPEVLATGKLYGFTGAAGAKQMGTLLQVAGKASGGKEDVAKTGAQALLRDLAKNKAKLAKWGIKVFDPNEPKKMRNIKTLMDEIIKKSGGAVAGKFGLAKIFGDESLKTAGAFSGKAAGVAQAAGERGGVKTMAAQLALRLGGVAKESEQVKRALAKLDAAFQTTGKKVLTWAAKNPYTTAGAAIGGKLALTGITSLVGWLMKRAKGGAAGAVGAATGVQPVYVVNMPGATVGQAAGFMQGKTAAAGAGATALGQKGASIAGVAAKAIGIGAIAGVVANYVGARDAEEKMKMASKRRTAKVGQADIGVRLAEQAAQLASLGKGGVTKFGAKGAQKELTQKNVLAVLEASAKRQGATDETLKAIAPVLRQLTATLAKGQTVKVVAPGIDGTKVAAGRKP